MQCPLCQAENPPTAETCTKCSTPLPLADATLSPTMGGSTAVGSTEAWSVAVSPRPASEAASKGQLEPGTLLADRFEIIQLLGQGGMGAVYKGRDIELDRLVALKLIRPDLASHPEILRRFKQELILAREVTHRNVIRIFDLGQARGIKFITMEYVEGRDLRSLIHEKQKLTVDEAVPIVLQIAAALEAAHHAGVVHRDLKPQNVLIDKDGRVYVMDFGIARSLETPGMTQTGALMGTPEYMSPEQAKGEKVDARSDLFALGIIFYEMLTGISPFKADTAMAMMFKRTQERATPLSQMNIGAPSAISDIVAKCLEIKPDERYQTARDVINDLEAWKGGAPRSIIAPPTRHVRYGSLYEKLLAGAAAVVLGLIAFSFRDKFISHSTPKGTVVAQPISLAILPFHNASTDVSLDWLGPSLADMLNEEVGNSQRLHAVSSSRIHQILKDLHQPANAEFDSDILRNIAQNCSADILVWGRYAKFGDTIRVDASVQDRKTGSTKPVKIEIPSEKDIPKSVPQLAELIRNNLSISEDVAKELKASSFRPSSQSVAALRDYDQGLQLIRDGKNLEAVKSLQSAIKEDPQFALAYSRLAATDAELGYDSDAEQNSRKAVELSQQLPLAEKYLIEANHARLMKDNKKAIEAYENLAKTFPGDADVEYDLGNLYKDSGEYDKAKAQFDKILSADPKNAKVLWQAGVVQIMKDNPQGAIDPLTQGHSAAVQLDNQEQNALILQALGVSYRLLNKPQEAMNNYQQSLEISRRLGLKRMQASSLSEMAQVQSTLGKPKEALASYNQALQLLHEIGMNKEIGDTLINRGVFYQSAGDYDKALQDFKESYQIQRDAGDENYQALCLSNVGSVYLAKGDADNALIYLQQALQLRQKLNDPEYVAETWGAMGDVYTSTGDYDKAVTAMMTALDLYHKSNDVRGWSAESRQMGTTLLAQGRMAAALSALQDSVKGYQSIGTRSREMVDAQRDLADALALAGRGDESSKPLQDAQDLARELNSPGVQSAISGAQGDVQFYGGNLKAARPAYEQALKAASQGKDKEQLLTAKLNLARLTIAEGRAPAAIPDLRAIVQQADSLNLKYLSLQGSVAMAEAMINTKDYARARQELERQLSKSEKLGSRLETARIHYLLGNAMRLGGSTSEAASQYQQALRLFDDMKKEPGAEKLLNRADLRPMYDDSTHWVSTLRG